MSEIFLHLLENQRRKVLMQVKEQPLMLLYESLKEHYRLGSFAFGKEFEALL